MTGNACGTLSHRALAAASVFTASMIVSFAGIATAGPPNGNGGPGAGGGTSSLYSLVDLLGFTVTYPGGSYIQSAAAAVNEPDSSGTVQVVGVSAFKLGDYTDNQSHPVLWEVSNDGSFSRVDLGLPPQAYQAYATDINDLGVITIKTNAAYDAKFPSWVSLPGAPMQQLPAQGDVTARRVNNFGAIVGFQHYNGLSAVWDVSGGPINLHGVQAAGISDTGVIVGHDGASGSFGENPWKDWEGGRVPTIGWFAADGSLQVERLFQLTPDSVPLEGTATAISPNGQWIAGYIVDVSRSAAQAFVWSNGTGMMLLNRLGGADCVAVDVNNNGGVVGWSDTGDRKTPVSACLWQAGQVYDLNMLAGASRSTNLLTACSINDAGHIVGYMDLNAKGGGSERHGYVLMPNFP